MCARTLSPVLLLVALAACGTTPGSVPNFHPVAPGVFRGGQPTEQGFRELRALGVKTVINLRSHHSDLPAAEEAGLEVVDIPMKANIESDPPTDQDVERFFDVVLDPARRPVYFHCKHGKDRTGTMAAIYRIEVDGWSNERAAQEMLDLGYHTYYRDLIDYVRAYKPQGYGRK
jgi:tyrosine-protein phosphatase SIW14